MMFIVLILSYNPLIQFVIGEVNSNQYILSVRVERSIVIEVPRRRFVTVLDLGLKEKIKFNTWN